jgi:hypothetical protein
MNHDYEVPTAQTAWGRLDAALGNRNRAKVARNTYARRLTDGNFGPIAVRLHNTDVVIASVDGTVRLDSGGWRTVTTKDRMCRYLPSYMEIDGFRVFASLGSDAGVWRVSRRWWRDAPTEDDPYRSERGGEIVSDYYDGMVLDAHGRMVTEPLRDTSTTNRDLKRAIKDYVALYTDERIEELMADAVEKGTAGDCWFCGMRTEDGTPLGDRHGSDHLHEHVREGYTMVTLLRNAIEARGYIDPLVILYHAPDLARKALSRYLTKRLTTIHGATPTGENYSATHSYYR